MLVADSTVEWTAAVSTLLSDAAHAERVGQAARNRVLADYSWDAHLQKFSGLIEAGREQTQAAIKSLATTVQ